MIYINLKAMTLRLHKNIVPGQGLYSQAVLCGIGRESTPTPKGIFTIVRKIVEPKGYYDLVKPEIFGAYVLELNISGIGDWDGDLHRYCIHGTDKESNFGTAHTRGCITLKHDALVQVFNEVEKGERVVIWDCPMADADFALIPNWRQIKLWPPPENSVSYRRNLPLMEGHLI